MKLSNAVVFAVLLLALPCLALGADAPEVDEVASVELATPAETTALETSATEDDDRLFAVQLFEDTVVAELEKDFEPMAAGCSAITRCYSGLTISCTGTSFCWTEPKCFVICDGQMTRCNSPCP